MEIYSSPVPFPDPDYKNYNPDKEQRREKEHQDALVLWLKESGYNGKHSGGILYEPFADGAAAYMLADGGRRKSFLIHLPYGDAWHSPNIEFLPKKEVVRRIGTLEKVSAIFAST